MSTPASVRRSIGDAGRRVCELRIFCVREANGRRHCRADQPCVRGSDGTAIAVTADTMRDERVGVPGDRLYRSWIRACALGELLGIASVAMMAILLRRVVGEAGTAHARWPVALATSAAGAIEGAALGYLQWRVLRRRLPRLRAGEWVGMTIALAVAGWLAGMSAASFGGHAGVEPPVWMMLLMATGLGAAAGAFFGAGQWLVLRHHAQHAGRWIGIHVPGWAVAMAAIFAGASVPRADWSPSAILLAAALGGLLGGVLLGATTGLVVHGLQPWVDERRWSLLMARRVCVVTGGTSGIGGEVAKGLARMGAAVILLCRDAARGDVAGAALAKDAANIAVVPCDLGSLTSVRDAATEVQRRYGRVDVLIQSAGASFDQRTLTTDGIEATLAVDAVGPHLLAELLAPLIERSGGRVIALAGISARRGQLDPADLAMSTCRYDCQAANARAQRARLLLTAELARRHPGLTALAVHPGGVLTPAQDRLPAIIRLLIRTILRPGFVRAELGALPVLRLAAIPCLTMPSGAFLRRYRPCDLHIEAEEAVAFDAACHHLFEARPSPLHAPARAGERR
jgi:retinol dehydrogenase-12